MYKIIPINDRIILRKTSLKEKEKDIPQIYIPDEFTSKSAYESEFYEVLSEFSGLSIGDIVVCENVFPIGKIDGTEFFAVLPKSLIAKIKEEK